MPLSATTHIPVMLAEVLQYLNPQPGQIIVDGTLGGGGHTRAIAQRVAPSGYVLALDGDPHALARAEESLQGECVKLAHERYCDLPSLLRQIESPPVAGVLIDLGLSSDQLAEAERGFSFTADGPLDLRFDSTSGEPAWRLIARLEEQELADILFRYGEERYSRRIARKIVAARESEPIRTAGQLAKLVRSAVPFSRDSQRIDPATRTFQGLRIAVNDELNCLEKGLARFPDCLQSGGVAVAISFHSLEDRLVKHAFREDDRWEILTPKPIRPTDAEMNSNPRSRSAKLRAARRK